MKIAAIAISFLALAAPAVADELADIAEKQKAAVYSPMEDGLILYHVGFGASIWMSDPVLKEATLFFRMPMNTFEARGVPADADEAAALESMKGAWGAASKLMRPSYSRVDGLTRNCTTTIRKIGPRTEVVGNTKPDASGSTPPKRVVVVLDEHWRLFLVAQGRPDSDPEVVSDFKWKAAGRRWLPTGYTVANGGRRVAVTIDWKQYQGVYLPVCVTESPGEGASRFFRFEYLKVLTDKMGAFASPVSTVKNFIDACRRGDPGMLGKCFSEHSDEEFTAIRRRELTREQLDELKAMFGESEVKDCQIAEEGNTAVVRITLKRGGRPAEEQVSLALDQGEWKIVSF